ncbi:hypothetical protein ACIO3O_06010 [Streptomyces sp. NPDC087440]|uniref:hypothetical protein n=1 Tax=Streptomyces sp. NPDC087440 TaxID=3365790 RepID=UPI00380AF5AF
MNHSSDRHLNRALHTITLIRMWAGSGDEDLCRSPRGRGQDLPGRAALSQTDRLPPDLQTPQTPEPEDARKPRRSPLNCSTRYTSLGGRIPEVGHFRANVSHF